MINNTIIDEQNLHILKLLQENGRISHSDISSTVGLSIPAVTERIKKMENAGIIKGYTAVLEAKKLEKDITAIINVTINDPLAYENFAATVLGIGEVLDCYHVVGEFDYVLKVKTRNTETLEALIGKQIRAIHGVERTRTNVVLSTVKESLGIDLEILKKEMEGEGSGEK